MLLLRPSRSFGSQLHRYQSASKIPANITTHKLNMYRAINETLRITLEKHNK